MNVLAKPRRQIGRMCVAFAHRCADVSGNALVRVVEERLIQLPEAPPQAAAPAHDGLDQRLGRACLFRVAAIQHPANHRNQSRGRGTGPDGIQVAAARIVLSAVEAANGSHQQFPRSERAAVRHFIECERLLGYRAAGDGDESLLHCERGLTERMIGRKRIAFRNRSQIDHISSIRRSMEARRSGAREGSASGRRS